MEKQSNSDKQKPEVHKWFLQMISVQNSEPESHFTQITELQPQVIRTDLLSPSRHLIHRVL